MISNLSRNYKHLALISISTDVDILIQFQFLMLISTGLVLMLLFELRVYRNWFQLWLLLSPIRLNQFELKSKSVSLGIRYWVRIEFILGLIVDIHSLESNGECIEVETLWLMSRLRCRFRRAFDCEGWMNSIWTVNGKVDESMSKSILMVRNG